MTLDDLVAKFGCQSEDFTAFEEGEWVECVMLFNQEDNHEGILLSKQWLVDITTMDPRQAGCLTIFPNAVV